MLKILLVEDREDDIFIARKIIRKVLASAHVTAARDGDEALALFTTGMSGGIDLILLDIQLPGTDGFSVYRQLRSLDVGNRLRIVFLTTSSSVHDREEAYRLGADGYIVKPMDIHEFGNTMRETIIRLFPSIDMD